MQGIAALQALLQPPAREGATVTGTCTALHRGRTTMMVWHTEVRREDGKLSGVVTQTQLVIPA